MQLSLLGNTVDNIEEVRLQGSTANESAINIGLSKQVLRVGTFHGTTVLDTDLRSNIIRNVGGDPLADIRMSFLGHFWCSRESGTNLIRTDERKGDEDLENRGRTKR